MATTHFTPALFSFLRELKASNTRVWFDANKARYERDVQQPMLRFIAALEQPLQSISPYVFADSRKVGGSLFRIYRDVRFAKDKAPYKTNVGAHFRHRMFPKDKSAPGFYFHLEPDNCMAGGGVYCPEPEVLALIRQHIVDDTAAWSDVRNVPLLIEGETLKRTPKGFDPAHPFAEDLRHKDFYSLVRFNDADVCRTDFLECYLAACRSLATLLRFLSEALAVPW